MFLRLTCIRKFVCGTCWFISVSALTLCIHLSHCNYFDFMPIAEFVSHSYHAANEAENSSIKIHTIDASTVWMCDREQNRIQNKINSLHTQLSLIVSILFANLRYMRIAWTLFLLIHYHRITRFDSIVGPAITICGSAGKTRRHPQINREGLNIDCVPSVCVHLRRHSIHYYCTCNDMKAIRVEI